MMKSPLTLVLSLVLSVFLAKAQQPEPVFRSPKDSMDYANIQLEINRLNEHLKQNQKNTKDNEPRKMNIKTGADGKIISVSTGMSSREESTLKKLDSLNALLSKLRPIAIIGYRYHYVPNSTYIPIEDLMNGEVSPDEVIHLSIANFKGPYLPEQVFACKNLESIELNNTKIVLLPRELNALSQLKTLYIFNNSPTQKLRISKNTHITFLQIRGYKPNMLPKTYKKFKTLDSLDLSINLLTEFPNIHKNHRLKKLVLNNNNLELSHARIRPNNHLENLSLVQNKITIVPGALGKFKGLKKITLNHNQIREIDPGFGKLQKLENLSLYQNKLTTIPPAIYSLHNLKELDLYYNAIENVSPEINQLQNLQVCYLSYNKIASLPESFGALTKLRELYLHHNLLKDLPGTIGNLTALNVLRINNNNFFSVPMAVFKLKGLKHLDVSRNMLLSLPQNELLSLGQLNMFVAVENPWENNNAVVELAKTMREKGIMVHLNSFENAIEDK